MIALGGLYFILPRITGKPLYSRFLADLQYWFVFLGTIGFTTVLTIVGLIQGNAWLNGEMIYRVLPELQIYYIMRAAVGLTVFVSALIGLYNIVRTMYFNSGEAA
jgi:cytochrome c oxidase cbb3-type subunit 1/cytochrome c oxidase cbb3-type subunit I/II